MDGEEILFRQVNPGWLVDGDEPSSQAFKPFPKDAACLSVDRASLTTAEASHTLFTADRPDGFGFDSVGVWGLCVREVEAQALTVWEDAIAATLEEPANPAHSVIEFGELGDKACSRAARVFKAKAIARGRLHPKANISLVDEDSPPEAV